MGLWFKWSRHLFLTKISRNKKKKKHNKSCQAHSRKTVLTKMLQHPLNHWEIMRNVTKNMRIRKLPNFVGCSWLLWWRLGTPKGSNVKSTTISFFKKLVNSFTYLRAINAFHKIEHFVKKKGMEGFMVCDFNIHRYIFLYSYITKFSSKAEPRNIHNIFKGHTYMEWSPSVFHACVCLHVSDPNTNLY